MTDEQIIDALKGGVLNAERVKSKCWSIEIYKLKNAIDLINRQKAEIENLKVELKAMRGAANSYKMAYEKETPYAIQVEVFDKIEKQIKSDAIKEFAKYIIDKSQNGIIYTSDIPDYVKEMTEEKE